MSAPSVPVETPERERVLLRDIAASRSGDKGDVVNVCVIPYDPGDWDLLRERLTEDVVGARFAGLVAADARVRRYELPGIKALNFVIEGALAGGVSASLRVDGHGKSFQSLILEIEL